MNQPQNALFYKAYLDVDMADGEIDGLFKCNQYVGEIKQ